MAEFPSEIFTPRETENLPGITYDPTQKQNMFSEDFQNLGNEINAIETIIGQDPQGSFTTVKDWISSLASSVSDLVSGLINGLHIGLGGGSDTTNIAIGENSLLGISPGEGFNVGVGTNTLMSNTTGQNNVAIGYNGQGNSPSGHDNVSVGYNCLAGDDSGYDNTAIGSSCLESINLGASNVGIGKFALENLGSGNNNVAIGTDSLHALSAASGSVGIGFSAGRRATESNVFYLGNVLQTTEANDKAFSLLFGNFSGSAGSLTNQQLTLNGDFTINGSLKRKAPVTKTDNFTVGLNENWIIVNKTASVTVTLPSAASFIGREIMIKTIQAYTVISNASNVVPLIGGTHSTAILAATAGRWATLVSNGTDWVIMQGN